MTEPTVEQGDPDAPPSTRDRLLEQHAEARHRRNAAPLGSEAWAAASAEVARIEVEIARIERSTDPPLV